MPTQQIDYKWQRGNEQIVTRISKTADGGIEADVAIPGASTDLQVILAIDVSALKMIWMECDRNLTIETNSGSAPDNTISLTAGVPYVWHDGCYFVNKLTADVENIYLTLAAGAAATLVIRGVQDITP